MESAGSFKVTFLKLTKMKEQNFENHSMIVPLFHMVTAAGILLGLVGAIINLVRALGHGEERLIASLLVVLFITAALLFWFVRSFALGAQDRAIRAEENLRYFSISGKLLDSRLNIENQLQACR